jgi:membrane-associated protease RseP (regulator of RpoE activity)
MGWTAHLGLFALTLGSAFVTYFALDDAASSLRLRAAESGQFACALLAILLAHEFGHYVAARLHGVPVSLPYFIPLPFISPFGTMGAIIDVRSTIPTRRALLDFGAAGPLAGLTLAIPLYAWGVAHSNLAPATGDVVELGDSLLLRALDALFGPKVPAGMTTMLSPVAFAAWAGMFVTMANLIPVAQLDGGHIAYALFGPRQNRIALWVHRSMLLFFAVSLTSFVARDVRAGAGLWHLGRQVNNSIFWVLWFEVLAIIGQITTPNTDEEAARVTVWTRVSMTALLMVTAWILLRHQSFFLWTALALALGFLFTMEARWGALRSQSTLLDHPPTGSERLSPGRAAVAILTLALFVLLFMPAPFVF